MTDIADNITNCSVLVVFPYDNRTRTVARRKQRRLNPRMLNAKRQY